MDEGTYDETHPKNYNKHEKSMNERYNQSKEDEMDEPIQDENLTEDDKRLSKSKTNSNNRFSERIGRDENAENVYADQMNSDE